MFATLKNKIKEETGKEVAPLPVRSGAQGRLQRSTFGSTSSQFTGDPLGAQYALEQKDIEVAALRLQCNDAAEKLEDAGRLAEAMRKDIERLEQSNQLLEESLKVAQRKHKNQIQMTHTDLYNPRHFLECHSAKGADLR